MDIFVNVVNQKLSIATNLKSITEGTQEFIRFVFNLSDDWEGLDPFAQFIQGENAYNVYLDEDNSAYLPPEITAGTCMLMLYGASGEVKATTNYVTLTIDSSMFISDASSTEITQSLYDQLVDVVDGFDSRITTNTTDITNLKVQANASTSAIGTISNLNTTDKSNLVSALNESNTKASYAYTAVNAMGNITGLSYTIVSEF